jgi:hypothetical protein
MKRTRFIKDTIDDADDDGDDDDDTVMGGDFLTRLGQVNGSGPSTFGIQAGESTHVIHNDIFDSKNPWPRRDGVLVKKGSDGEIVTEAPDEEDFGFKYRENVFKRRQVIENDPFSQFLTILAGEIGEETTDVLYDAESIKDQRNYEAEMRRLEEYERKRIENGTVEKEEALKRQEIEMERLDAELNDVRDTHHTLTALLTRMTPFTTIVPKDDTRLSSFYLCNFIAQQYQFVTRIAMRLADDKVTIKPVRLTDEEAKTYENLFISQKGNPALLHNEGAKFQLDQARVLFNQNFSTPNDFRRFLCLLWRALYIRDVSFTAGTVAKVYEYDEDVGEFKRKANSSTMRWSVPRLFNQTTRDLIALAVQSNKLLSIVMAADKPLLISRTRYLEQVQLLNEQIMSKNRLLIASPSEAEREFQRTAVQDIEKKRDDLVTAYSKLHEEVDKNVDVAVIDDASDLLFPIRSLFVDELMSYVGELTKWFGTPFNERSLHPLFDYFPLDKADQEWKEQLMRMLIAHAMSTVVESVTSIEHSDSARVVQVKNGMMVSAHMTSFLIAVIGITLGTPTKIEMKITDTGDVEVTLRTPTGIWEKVMTNYDKHRTDDDRRVLDGLFTNNPDKVTVKLKLKDGQDAKDFINRIRSAATDAARPAAFRTLVLEKHSKIYEPMPQFKDSPNVFELMRKLRKIPNKDDPLTEIASFVPEKSQFKYPISHLALDAFSAVVAPRLLGFISTALVFFLRDMDTGIGLQDEVLTNLVNVFKDRSTRATTPELPPGPNRFDLDNDMLYNYKPNRSLLDTADSLLKANQVILNMGALASVDYTAFNEMLRHLESLTSPLVSGVFKAHPSLKLIFNAIFWNNHLYAPRERELSDRREDTRKSAESLRRQVLKIFQSEPRERRERMKELKQLYVPSAQWQMQPMITGIQRLSSRTVAALENGLQLTRTWVESLKYATLDELTQSNMDSGLPGAFARLVAALWNKTSLIHAHTYNKDIQYKLDPQIRKESLDALHGFHVQKDALGRYVAHRQHPSSSRHQQASRANGSGASNVTVYYL